MSTNKYGLDLEINDLWYTPFWRTTAFYFIVVIVLLVMLLAVIWWYQNRSEKCLSKDQILKLISDIYLLRLDIKNLDYQTFYFELIGYVGQFAKYQYRFDISSKSDLEIKKTLKNSNLDTELQNLIIHLLNSSEKIRFASDSSSRVQMEIDLQKVLTVVEIAAKSKK
jgi:hypothetical protein